MSRRSLLALVVLAAVASPAYSQDGLPQLKTVVAFPNLKFNRPVALAYPKDGSNLLFVLEQHNGEIYSFTNNPETPDTDKKLFLKLSSEMNKDNEEGLLGLAFHPKYKENGQFFVYYSAKVKDVKSGRRSVVSRFNVSKDDPRKADANSEVRIWASDEDPYGNHNGGCIEFGPDGYLYISLGDSGAADDPKTTGQNPADWWGSILRIDVDKTEGEMKYAIPSDNPAKRDAKFAHWAPEVYCIGLRNVWKFTFDRKTGDLWAGDVGQNKWEIVHLIKNGGNYGWSVKEGFHDFRPRVKTDTAAVISKPVFEYPHDLNLDRSRKDVGKSITGGYVYRGTELSELVGAYVFGDFDSGRIWGLREQDGATKSVAELVDVSKGKLAIAAFGEDPKGEIYVLAFDGKIYKFAAR